MVYLLYGVWHIGIYEPEEQVSEGPALSPQNHGTSAPSMGQGQVDGQQLHAQQKKLMVVPEEYIQRALGVSVKGTGGKVNVSMRRPGGGDAMGRKHKLQLIRTDQVCDSTVN